MPEHFEQLSLFNDNAAMRVGGVRVKLLDTQQFLVNGIGGFYGTTLKVQSLEPLDSDEEYLTVTGSDIEVLNGAQFYIRSMHHKPGRYYLYSLVGVQMLPRIT